ncbi:Calmodulin-binding receptor-like cytoplasmic kinase 2 [Ananas comosus]|uniref:non-specific serine/threonine protein kinase n=1 Tax=Ananas comosus TaxID=4615 RepID=A0A199VQJ1_ANACO|nr:Calmodulin-binding receptor-like cytoplasmic kinase 2 [Ananas comosus]
MQISSNPQLNSRPSSQTSGTSPGFPWDPDISCTSTYTARSTESGDSKFHRRRTKSFSIAAQKVAGAFTTCFVPKIRTGEVADRDNRIDDSFISTSSSSSKISKLGIRGISSSYNIKTRGSSSLIEEQKEFTTKFSIAEIYKATENFNPRNQIGEGGFGTIYKGKLQDGSLIAVKRAAKNMYGKHLSTEFKSEIEALSKVQHMNLVRFLGWVEHEGERLIVVEYVGNGTLREHLDGTRGNGLDLGQRLNIAIDVAHAITYLHGYADDPIIHRDVKASNVLLTEALQGKVGDLGFARVVGAGEAERTHVSTQVKGTAGYVDPEYLRTYQLTPKSDVYSFGVLLVELVSGRRPIERGRGVKERVTTRWAIRKYLAGDVGMTMDPRLKRGRAAVAAVESMMGLAVKCLESSRESRPSMKECAEVLWTIRRDYDQHSQQQQQQQQQQPLLTPTAASSNDAVSSVKDVSSEKREENTVKSPKQKW